MCFAAGIWVSLPDGLVYLGALVRQQGVGCTVDSVHRSAGYDTEEERCRRDKSCRLGVGVFLRSVVAVLFPFGFCPCP